MEPTTQPEKTSSRKNFFLVVALFLLLLGLGAIIIFGMNRSQSAPDNLPMALQAIQQTNSSTNLAPGRAFIQATKGLTFAQQGKLVEAMENFREVVRARPDDAEAHFNLAEALVNLGDVSQDVTIFNDAAFHYAEAIRLNPRDTLSMRGYALTLGKLGRYQEAAAKFEQLLASRPEDGQVQYYVGLSRVIVGKREDAIGYFRKSIELDPSFALAFNDLAWILATHPKKEFRNGEEAVRLAEHGCRLSGGTQANFFGTLDAAYAEVGRFDDALLANHTAARLAEMTGQKDLLAAAREREKLYLQKKPYRQR